MNWRIIVGVVIAFVLGGAAGALAEHERVTRESSNKKTTTTVAADNWFAGKKAAACPTLKSWNESILASAVAASSGSNAAWSTTRATLLQRASAISASYGSLVTVANQHGKVELDVLIAYQNQATTGLKAAKSNAAYAASQKKLESPRVIRDINVLLQAANACPKS